MYSVFIVIYASIFPFFYQAYFLSILPSFKETWPRKFYHTWYKCSRSKKYNIYNFLWLWPSHDLNFTIPYFAVARFKTNWSVFFFLLNKTINKDQRILQVMKINSVRNVFKYFLHGAQGHFLFMFVTGPTDSMWD